MIKAEFILNNYCSSYALPTKRKAGNGAYIRINNHKYLVTRETDYIYGKFPDGKIHMYLENDGASINRSHEALYELTDTNCTFIKYLTHSTGNDWGFEDPRTAMWNDECYLFFARRNLSNFLKVEVHLYKLDTSLTLVNGKIINGNQLVEKNWGPISDKPFQCIYSVNPVKIIDTSTECISLISNQSDIPLCGSSNFIRIGDHYLAIHHIRNADFEYIHYLAEYDTRFNRTRISQPFSFLGLPVEYNCHIEFVNDQLIVLVSVHDQIIYEFSISDILIDKMLNHTIYHHSANVYDATIVCKQLIDNNNIPAAIILAGFSNNLSMIKWAIENNFSKNYFRNGQQAQIASVLINHLKTLISS